MTDRAALVALRDAVREGRDADAIAQNRRMASAARDKGDFWHADDVAKVIEQYSTDAALALFGALLPKWRMDALWQGGVMARTQEVWHCRLRNVSGLRAVCTDERMGYDTPARAWLLAIIEALIQEAKE